MLPQSLLDDYARTWEMWDHYEHGKYDAKHAVAVSDQLVDWTAIVGTPDQCAETIHKVMSLGFDGLSLGVFTIRDRIGFWRDFHDEVCPLLEDT